MTVAMSIDSAAVSPASPRASVLLPVYNAEAYLEKAARSVLGQTYRDFELLFLNDGSSDGSAEVIDRLVREDDRCRVLAWPNRGLVASLNAGLAAARGEFILRMDADDVCRPDRFSRQIEYLDTHTECVAVGSRVLLIDPDGLPIMEMGDRLIHEEIDAGNLSGEGCFMCHPAAAMRRDAAIRVGGYRDEYRHAEDVDFFLRMAEIGRLANLPGVLLEYRQHPASIGYAKRAAQVHSIHAAVAEAHRRRRLAAGPTATAAAIVETVPSMADVHRKWAWWALTAGHVGTARKHARLALAQGPLDWRSWKLFACAVRGH